jgi:hypothetical protein
MDSLQVLVSDPSLSLFDVIKKQLCPRSKMKSQD